MHRECVMFAKIYFIASYNYFKFMQIIWVVFENLISCTLVRDISVIIRRINLEVK